MNLTMTEPAARHASHSDRRIPGWAAGLVTHLARDRPPVVTRADLARLLAETGSGRQPEATAQELRRLGWLIPLHVNGAWAFLPPGEVEVTDPYIDLRGWQARDPDAVLALAGEAAAWHLGYLDRAFGGPPAVWIPDGRRLPHGLRSRFTALSLGWLPQDAQLLGPAPRLLHRRRLDLTRWATGLPALGPEALLVQLACRPSSFRVWADLISHLEELAGDCDPDRLIRLLQRQSGSSWQRAAYLLARGGRRGPATEVLRRRPGPALAKAQFGAGGHSAWDGEFHIADHLIAPLQAALGKA
jgi:hypothetical protein